MNISKNLDDQLSLYSVKVIFRKSFFKKDPVPVKVQFRYNKKDKIRKKEIEISNDYIDPFSEISWKGRYQKDTYSVYDRNIGEDGYFEYSNKGIVSSKILSEKLEKIVQKAISK